MTDLSAAGAENIFFHYAENNQKSRKILKRFSFPAIRSILLNEKEILRLLYQEVSIQLNAF